MCRGHCTGLMRHPALSAREIAGRDRQTTHSVWIREESGNAIFGRQHLQKISPRRNSEWIKFHSPCTLAYNLRHETPRCNRTFRSCYICPAHRKEFPLHLGTCVGRPHPCKGGRIHTEPRACISRACCTGKYLTQGTQSNNPHPSTRLRMCTTRPLRRSHASNKGGKHFPCTQLCSFRL